MSTKESRITVSIAQTPDEINQALAFCSSVYEKNYGTHWTVPPDLFFIAREQDEIVATGGLTFAAMHPQISSERYYQLTDGMRNFIDMNRERIAEFGRFASIKAAAAKAILHSALSYCTMAGIDFIFAWANPSVSKHTSHKLGLNFWPIAVPLNLDNALSDTRWASPPVGFFQREPALHLGVIPFWENVTKGLIDERRVTAVPAWQNAISREMPVAAMKPTSFVHAAPRLMRAGNDKLTSAPAKIPAMPQFDSVPKPEAALRKAD